MKVIALEKFEYANKLHMPGDELDTDDDEHARLLVLAKRVRLPMAEAALEAETDDEKPKKQRYRTRDMRPRG